MQTDVPFVLSPDVTGVEFSHPLDMRGDVHLDEAAQFFQTGSHNRVFLTSITGHEGRWRTQIPHPEMESGGTGAIVPIFVGRIDQPVKSTKLIPLSHNGPLCFFWYHICCTDRQDLGMIKRQGLEDFVSEFDDVNPVVGYTREVWVSRIEPAEIGPRNLANCLAVGGNIGI